MKTMKFLNIIAPPFAVPVSHKKAARIRSIRLLHMLSPCPKGWKFDEGLTLEMGRLAVETGLWTLYEWENAVYHYSHIPKTYKPVSEYTKFQGRFTHLKEEHIAKMQAFVDEKIQRIKVIAVQAPIPTPKQKA